MARPELGSKHQCSSCETKFFDLGKKTIICPKCGTQNDPVPAAPEKTTRSAKPAKPAAEVKETVVEKEVVEESGVEIVSLEEAEESPADDELAALKDVDDIEDDNETIDKSAEDNTFLESDDDDAPVSDLIDGGIKKNEDT